MEKYTIVSTLYRLPKHQRRRLLGKPVTRQILGHSIIKERAFFASSDEVNLVWDELKELYLRGEIEVRNPDGTLLRFVKAEVVTPPEDRIQKLPISTPIAVNQDFDSDEIEYISPKRPVKKEESEPKKKRGRKKKDK